MHRVLRPARPARHSPRRHAHHRPQHARRHQGSADQLPRRHHAEYRGIHLGYWAKAEGDLENFGVTVHLVDPGIDTGAVLYQERVTLTDADNDATFPYLQLTTVLPLMEQAARDALAGKLVQQTVNLPSRLWSHPDHLGSVAGGLRRRAW